VKLKHIVVVSKTFVATAVTQQFNSVLIHENLLHTAITFHHFFTVSL